MTTTTFKHEGVKPDGTFEKQMGAVHTEGVIRRSMPHGGCDIEKCHCSDGHWITVVQPRTKDGIVEGIRYNFDNANELEEFELNNPDLLTIKR